MSRLDALRALHDAVKDGTATWYDLPEMCEAIWGDNVSYVECVRGAYAADDLSAARALHDAVRPGWQAQLSMSGAALVFLLYPEEGDRSFTAFVSGKPARALLLALIASLIDEEERE